MFGGGQVIKTSDDRVADLRLQTSSHGKGLVIVFGTTRCTPNLFWYGDFTPIAHTETQSSGGKGGGGVTQEHTSYTYTCAFMLGIAEGPIYNVLQAWANKNKYPTYTNLALGLYGGDYSQSAWPHLTANHPTEALEMRGEAYMAASAFNLGNTPSLPNFAFEVQGTQLSLGFNLASGAPSMDANVAECILDSLSNAYWGAGFPVALRDSMNDLRTYCRSIGLFISPELRDPRPVVELIHDWCKIANSAPVWSDGLLKIIPFADTPTTFNSVTFTPNTTPQYDLTVDDFLSDVKVVRKSQGDIFNQIKIEFLNRANDYNIDIASATDSADVELNGLRPAPIFVAHAITDASVALQAAFRILQRSLYIKAQYHFTVGLNYSLLDCMDLVTITVPELNLTKQPVRIIEIAENSSGELAMVAEIFPKGSASATLYPTQPVLGYQTNYNLAGANVSAPAIFEAPIELAENLLEVWIAVTSTNANWGGCRVWASTDDATYKEIGRVRGGARYGQLTAALPVGAGYDVANTLSVSLNRGQLLSGSLSDAQNMNTLCYVDGEYISYETATLTGTNAYNITKLQRCAYETPCTAHAIGSTFVRCDQAIVKFPLDLNYIGKTIYLKFTSVNAFGANEQNLADVSRYTYTVTGVMVAIPPPPPDSFLVNRQSDGTREFRWGYNVIPKDISGYKIGFRLGTGWTWPDLSPMHNGVLTASPFESNQLAAGNYTFGIKAVDILNNESATAEYITAYIGDPRLAGALDVFDSLNEGWPGTKTSCHLETATGFLQPNETNANPWLTTWANKWIITPAPSFVYERFIDVGLVAVFTPLVSFSGDGTPTIEESHSNDNVTYTAYATAGPQLNCRYVKIRLTLAGTWPIAKNLTIILSANPVNEDIEDIAMASLTGAYRIAIGDVRLPKTKSFNVIRKVDLTLQNVGAGWSWELVDKNTVTGPRIRTYNAANALADCTIDASIRGL